MLNSEIISVSSKASISGFDPRRAFHEMKVIRIIYCCVCSKQCLDREVSKWDKYCTTLIGAKANFGNTVFCGYCAKDLDEYGLFPEERTDNDLILPYL